MALSHKHVVITGGASGIGLELVKQLYDRNTISVIARPSAGLLQLRKQFGRINIHEADFADLQSVDRAARALVDTGAKIDVLINNAAVQYTPHFTDEVFRHDQIKREIDINFTSVCCLIHLTLPALMQERPSIILNLNSGLGFVAKTGSAVYCATKGAINILSQSLRHQLEQTNIRVMQAFLPLVDTQMTRGRGSGKLTPEDVAARIIKGLEGSKLDIDIGKVKILRIIHRCMPWLARRIMKAG